jgi:hypothetical protein
MAKEASFQIDGTSFSAALTKVDREKVYGWVEERHYDGKGNPLSWATLLLDGKTLIGTGGTALKTLGPDGEEVSKSALSAILPDGSPAELQKSVYDEPVELDASRTVDDLMRLEVKAVYQLSVSDGLDAVKAVLAKHSVLYFKFNYRADYETDDAFVIGQGDHVFIITGILQEFEFAYPEKPAVVESAEEESDSSLDFNMF